MTRQLTAMEIGEAQAVAKMWLRVLVKARVDGVDPGSFTDFAVNRGLSGPALLYAQGLAESVTRR